MLNKLETVELKLHQMGISTLKETNLDGTPKLVVFLSEVEDKKFTALFDWIQFQLHITSYDTHAVKSCIKETCTRISGKMSTGCLAIFSAEFWHFRTSESVTHLNVPLDAFKNTMKMLENAPIEVRFSLEGERPIKIEAELTDEAEFVKVMWCIVVQYLLLLIVDPALYEGAALVSTVEMFKNFADVANCNKRLIKCCGFEDEQKKIYLGNVKQMRSLSGKLIPLLAKANRVMKSLGHNSEIPFYVIEEVGSAVSNTDQQFADLCSIVIEKVSTLVASLLVKLMILPAVVCDYEIRPEAKDPDPMWNHSLRIFGKDEETYYTEIFVYMQEIMDYDSLGN
jgi:hypothetical protein